MISERFLIAYLKEYNLEYKVKNGVYKIEFDKQHQKWYDIKTLMCTFIPNKATDKILLLEPGKYIFESMVSRNSDFVIAKLKLPKNNDDLMELNEKLPKTGVTIDEKKDMASFVMFDVNISTANQKKKIVTQYLIIKNKALQINGFEEGNFEATNEKNIVKNLEPALNQIKIDFVKEFDEADKIHEKDMKELINIQTQHSEDLYNELQNKENVILNKIQEARDNALLASQFSTKDKWNYKVKELKRKHTELIKKNLTKRETIKKEFDIQINQLERRDLNVEATLIAYAEVDLEYFSINYNDGKKEIYIPCLKRFLTI